MVGVSSSPSRVVVLMGGPSAEREVSLSTGRECAEALRGEGFDVIEVDAGPFGEAETLAARLRDINPDCVFNALHGRWGEDGCVQGLLEWLRIPYTHSGVCASAVALDKTLTKSIYRAHGLPVAESGIFPRDDASASHVMPTPYVIKPNNEGSSVGIYLVEAGANRPPQLGPEMPEEVLVEAYIPGRELTVTVLGQGDEAPGALTVTEIVTEGWYDFDAKYKPGGSHHVVPAELPAEIFDACMSMAETAHRALGCKGVSRTDFRWDDSKGLAGLILLETNTQPGMTPTSLTPEQAEAKGMSFGKLCRWLVEDASCDR